MLILNGKALAQELAEGLKTRVALMPQVPKLAIVQVGERPESTRYIERKKRFGEALGVPVSHTRLPESVRHEEIVRVIEKANADASVGGIILQLPLPAHLEAGKILDAINPAKDVDGLTSTNIKALFDGRPGFIPATARGIATLLKHNGIDVAGKRVTIVGRSALVGKPLALLMLRQDATVTICHSKTLDLAAETSRADVLIVAAGKPGLITRQHVREGQVVVDVGITMTPEGIRGDVDFEAVSKVVEAISPVPGGVGPMTVCSLFENVLECAIHRA